MLKNYFKIAWRNISKSRFSSSINIGGLAVGIAVAIMIGLWMHDELSFDKYHKNYNRIAQVKQHLINNGQLGTGNAMPYPVANELRKHYGSDFKHVVLMGGAGEHILGQGDKRLSKQGAYAEKGFIDMFSLKMLSGSAYSLDDPTSVILSQSAAKAFFGDADPVDQLMKIDNRIDVKVTGVYEDLPQNSSLAELQFISTWDIFFQNTEWIRTHTDPWRPNAFLLYVQLADNADIAKVSEKIKDVKLRNVNEQLAKKKPALFLHAMSKWHLYGEFKNGVNTGGAIQYVWLFGTIGVFVLLLACINFMNLSTARSERRAREVGIRKAIGSQRSQLIYQFFCESILIALLSFLVSLVLVQLLLPFFNNVASKDISVPWSYPVFWLFGIGFTLLTGIIAGSYPALYFSSFKPVRILKGAFRAGRWAAIPRKALVVLQFTVSLVMIIGTLVVFRQIQFAKDRPIGYNTDGLVEMPMINEEIHKHFDAVKSELMNKKTIVSLAESGGPVTNSYNTSSGFEWKGKDPNMSVDFPRVNISYDYGKTIGWEFVKGRDFSKNFASDSVGMILNESAVEFMGLENPIGETIRWFDEPYTVVGVVKDMIMQNPYERVKPTIFVLYTGSQNFVIAKLNPSIGISEALANIESVFKKFNPEQPFQYNFTDEEYAKKFQTETRVGKLAGFFAALAIFISCLGLFGMVTFVAEQRVKEIGIRKVLGASVPQIVSLLSKDFMRLVILAFVIAVPLAAWAMHDWLEDFTYRTAISWWIFAVSGLSMIFIALLTLSIQTIRSAMSNPVKSLKV